MQEEDFPVSQPTGFRHAAHIGPEGVTVAEGFRVQDLPVEYVDLFRRAGLTKRELKNPDTLAFAPCLCGQLGAGPSDRLTRFRRGGFASRSPLHYFRRLWSHEPGGGLAAQCTAAERARSGADGRAAWRGWRK